VAAGGARGVRRELVEPMRGGFRLEVRDGRGVVQQVCQFDGEKNADRSTAASAASSARTPRSHDNPSALERLSATLSARPAGESMSRSVRCTTTSLVPSVLTITASVNPMSIAASCVVLPAMMLQLRSTRIDRPAPNRRSDSSTIARPRSEPALALRSSGVRFVSGAVTVPTSGVASRSRARSISGFMAPLETPRKRTAGYPIGSAAISVENTNEYAVFLASKD
jgi:hypothetical protein